MTENIQLEIDGKVCCPTCKSPISVSPGSYHTANIGWVIVTQDAYCDNCGHKFTYKTGYNILLNDTIQIW